MQAHGETAESVSGNKWARTRPLASKRGFDKNGCEHVWLQFHIDGELLDPNTDALVRMEMIRDPHGSNTFEYRYLVLEVPNHPRVYLIENKPSPAVKAKSTGFLGVKWGKKEENSEN